MIIQRGRPYRENHSEMMYLATMAAEIDFNGITSNHLVLRSIMVSKYEYPSSIGSGPTKSIWRTSNRFPVGKCISGGLMWRVTLFFWHMVHSETQSFTSRLIEGQMTLLRRSSYVPADPGWCKLCKALNACLRRCRERIGRRVPGSDESKGIPFSVVRCSPNIWTSS